MKKQRDTDTRLKMSLKTDETKRKNLRDLLIAVIVLIVLCVIYFTRFANPNALKKTAEAESVTATEFKLNTIVTVTFSHPNGDQLLKDVMALCDKYENIFSRTKEGSEIYKLNHGTLEKDGNAFVLSPECAELAAKGLEYSELSGGAFDITIEPVSSQWDFTSESKKIPSETDIADSLPLVDYKNVNLDGNRLTFAKEGMGLDLGAIAKGYIADKMKEFLVENGVESGIINLGGNVLCIGEKQKNTPFRIGIQKPFAGRSETIATIAISDRSVVSSGIYERYFEKNGKLYHHILNPKTGYPYDNSLVAVTIISDKSVDGDALSTTCFALGLERGMELIDSLADVHAVFITDDYKLHYSKDFKKAISVNQSKKELQVPQLFF